MMREILIPLSVGLMIFLFGLQLMRRGLNALAGDRLQRVLLRFTKTPLRGFITGTIATGFLQSSSAVTVLTIGFADAGVLSFAHSIGIVLGTNVGTTLTTEILALNIEDCAVPLCIFGSILFLLPNPLYSRIGMVVAGFGCIFLGIQTMQSLATPLQEKGWIAWMMEGYLPPVVMGILAGAIITALIHSSSATIALTMGFYASGMLTLPFAIAVVLGSNVGTCFTAIIAAFRTTRAAKQVALSHIILNVCGVLICVPFIPEISQLAPRLSSHPEIQIAHIQTLFNVICSLAALPFAKQFAHFITWLTRWRPSRTT